MLRTAIAVANPNQRQLATIKQIGVEHIVHYDMSNTANKFDSFERLVEQVRDHGLTVSIVEAGPSIRDIVSGTDDGRELKLWSDALPMLAANGVEVICYNFMPQVTDDAMVLRTSSKFQTRGGARTSGYLESDLTHDLIRYPAPAAKGEDMWANLEAFLTEIVPKAEAVGISLAMHPDDPPVHDILGYSRIMSSVADFERLLQVSTSPSNGLTLCAGCFGEAGYDVPAIANRFVEAVKFVHYRNIADIDGGFIETFPDNGKLNLFGMIDTLLDAGSNAFIRCDHSPLLAIEDPSVTLGYGFLGHLYTTGYMKGLIDTCAAARASSPPK